MAYIIPMRNEIWYYADMNLQMTISNQIPEAMRAKDSVRLLALRSLKAACANELVAQKRSTNDALADDEALAVIRRLVKQRKDSIEQFRKGGREEMAQAEEAECKILEAFLPAQMSEADVRKIAEGVQSKLGATDKSKLGQLIGAVMKETRGRADGGMVKKVVETLLT